MTLIEFFVYLLAWDATYALAMRLADVLDGRARIADEARALVDA